MLIIAKLCSSHKNGSDFHLRQSTSFYAKIKKWKIQTLLNYICKIVKVIDQTIDLLNGVPTIIELTLDYIRC